MIQSSQELQTRNILNANQFNCVRKIGKGGFGHVLLATKATSSSTFYAIKCLSRKKMIKDPQLKKSLIQEINTMAALEHPNIVKLYKTFEGSSHIKQKLIGIFLSWSIVIWVIFTPSRANSPIRSFPSRRHSISSARYYAEWKSYIRIKLYIVISNSKISSLKKQIRALLCVRLEILGWRDFWKFRPTQTAELRIIWLLKFYNRFHTGRKLIFGHQEFFFFIYSLASSPSKVPFI